MHTGSHQDRHAYRLTSAARFFLPSAKAVAYRFVVATDKNIKTYAELPELCVCMRENTPKMSWQQL